MATRAVVIGLAATGVAVARTLRTEGWAVTIVEDAPGATAVYHERAAIVRELGARLVEAPADAQVRDLVTASDMVVPSPLVRPQHPAVRLARAHGVAVRSEIDLAAERTRVPIVAVTGTNGKTTVTTMIAAMLEASGRHAVAAGNIGRPLIEAVAESPEVFVAEVSSFQLELSAHFRPRVAIELAITPDHLDWHGSFEAYLAAKARIVAHQAGDDLLVYDADDEHASAIARDAPARTVGVSLSAHREGCYRVVDEMLVFPDGRELAAVASMRRALLHDRTNALAAAAAALDAGAHLDGVRATLASYETMPHRVALVSEANGVRWYDDSKATNPDAALRAVASFGSVVLVAGGRNKGLDLGVLARAEDRLRGVVAFGESAPEVAAAFAATPVPVVKVKVMTDAVRAAAQLARPGDVVLLSPACASFDAYSGYAARGDDFAAEVRKLVHEESPTS